VKISDTGGATGSDVISVDGTEIDDTGEDGESDRG